VYRSLDGGVTWAAVGPTEPNHLVALFDDPADTAVKRVATTRLGAIPPLALGRDRFSVDIVRVLPNGLERGRTVDLASDSGLAWFFDRQNLELLVKVLDGRAINGHYWVYWGSTSDVAFDLCVEDTEAADPADAERCWSNPAGTFASGGDVTAFE